MVDVPACVCRPRGECLAACLGILTRTSIVGPSALRGGAVSGDGSRIMLCYVSGRFRDVRESLKEDVRFDVATDYASGQSRTPTDPILF